MRCAAVMIAIVCASAVAHAQGSAAGSGSAMGSGTGSGSAAPKVLIIIPPDVVAPEVSAAASPSDVRLGGRFTLFVTAVYGDGIEVNLREPVELGGAFEVRKRVSEDHTRADGKKVREWQLDVYAWELGEMMVPPIAVTFTSGGKAGQVATNAVPVRVSGVLGDADDPKLMREAAPPVRLMSRDWLWVYVTGAVVGVLAIATAILVVRRRRKRHVRTLVGGLVASVPRKKIDMTSERALEQLLAIEQSGVLDRDEERRQGYTEMVDVIREYIGARYHFETADLTTSELMKALGDVAPARERELVDHWLERCDWVKYGGFRASADDGKAALEAARRIVIETTAAAHNAKDAAAKEAAA